MPATCHSEFLSLTRVLLFPPENAFQGDTKLENEWRALNYLARPDMDLAVKEYQQFESLLSRPGLSISHFDRDTELGIDAIYCRDASVATNFGMVICNMGKAFRKKEPHAQKKAFDALGIPVLGTIKAPGTLEGGDVAWLDEVTLAVGHSYRTNEAGIRQLEQLLTPFGISIIVADLPHYKGPSDVFHLMSVLSPVDRDLMVVYSPLLPVGFRSILAGRGYRFVEVPDEEFDSMGCNVLALAPRKCIMVEGNPKTMRAIQKAGGEVATYPGREISLKGGGGPTCLTRPISRQY